MVAIRTVVDDSRALITGHKPTMVAASQVEATDILQGSSPSGKVCPEVPEGTVFPFLTYTSKRRRLDVASRTSGCDSSASSRARLQHYASSS